MSKFGKAVIADVERTLESLKQMVALDSKLEAEMGKKLGAAIDELTPKDGVTKDLNQAYNHGKNWWSTNVTDGNLEGCNADNKLEKIKLHVLRTAAYSRHHSNPQTKPKVERWLQEKFATVVGEEPSA